MSLELTRKKKSTFFVQIACYLKEKVQKKVGGSRRATCVIAFREIGTCMFSKIFMSILISCWLTQKRIINIQGKFVFWSLMYWDEKGCLQRWMQCCRLDLTRGGWAGLKGTLLRQLSPQGCKTQIIRTKQKLWFRQCFLLLLTVLTKSFHPAQCTLQSKLGLF